MRILHVCESVKGGTATYPNELIPLQTKMGKGHQVLLLMPREHAAEVPDIDPTSLVFFSRPSRRRGVFNLFCSAVVTLIRFRPDIIHAHSTFAGVIMRLLGLFSSAKVIYCPHGWAMDMGQSALKQKMISFVEYALSFLCCSIIAISDYERRRGIQAGIPAKKITTIHNGLSIRAPNHPAILWEEKRLKILFIGRLDRQKGIDILLEAIKPLVNKVSLRIIGSSVTSTAQIDFSHFPNIEYLGWQKASEVAAQMAVCDAVVMPSRWEGFGFVAIEAMRMSKPVIASSVGGLAEVVVDGETGYLFPVHDHATLSRILLNLDRAKLKDLGYAGRERFLKEFTSDLMYKKITQLYETCLR